MWQDVTPRPGRSLPALALLALAQPAVGETTSDVCAALALPNAYLQGHFCDRLKALAEAGGTTAPTRGFDEPDAETKAIIDGVVILNEAYRADPKKTLALISRIRKAGGLTEP